MSRYLFLGRPERLVIGILAIMAITALGLYAWSCQEPAMSVSAEMGRGEREPKATVQGDSIYKDKDYVGPPSHLRKSTSHKFDKRVVLDLNRVDSATLTRVPGIGAAFARRILALREKLGGYYTVLQLQEVYGMDEEKYLALKPWFAIQSPPRSYPLSELRAGEVPRHLYLSWEQQRALNRLLYKYGVIHSWSQLMRESCFDRDDSIRLSPYFVERAPSPASQMDSLHKKSSN